MHYRIEAKYFDGQSSVPHQITIAAIDQLDELRLLYANGASFSWQVDDLCFEQYGNCLEIRNKQFSGALLQICDEAFSKMFLAAMKRKNKVDVHHRILSIGFPKIVGIAVGMLALIVLAYFYVLPPVAAKSAVLLPEEFDTYLGDIGMRAFLYENTIDSAKTAQLEQFAAHIDFENTKPLYFSVIDSYEVNAFALPNGHIIVYSGILDKMQNSSELAALLAHEAAHVNHRHSVKMLCNNLAGYILISLIFSDVNGIMAVLADNAQQLHSLSYSRKFENESDEQGLKILMDNHIDPNGMVQLFELIEKEDKIAIPKIISTHPLTSERKENMQEIIEKSEYNLLPNNDMDSIFMQLRQ
ncbi:MAG: M48 family metallopeptidase [Bacteroidetes bacterium]|nr:M48 family metallopeptidase [Bacteroidota bacterium]